MVEGNTDSRPVQKLDRTTPADREAGSFYIQRSNPTLNLPNGHVTAVQYGKYR